MCIVMRCVAIASVTLALCLLSSCSSATSCEGVNVHGQLLEEVAVVLNEASLADNTERFIEHVSSPLFYVNFDDPRSILKFILRTTPENPTVFPTERYYYYQFPLALRMVSGNIRFAEVERGVVTVGYFDSMYSADMRVEEFRDGEEGVRVEHDANKHEVVFAVDGIERVFHLDQSAFTSPLFELYEGEKHISGVRDESGYYFHLLYWANDRSFYYVVNEDMPLPEDLLQVPHADLDIFFGEKSRFCFVRDKSSNRLVLVGVSKRGVQLNTWYDGPFDQVPPYLNIKSILEEAYPYVTDAGGIDEHGKFLEREGQRIAISPYSAYRSGVELVEDLEVTILGGVSSPAAWTGATYEYKKDWRAPTNEDGYRPHNYKISGAWPANHWGKSSRKWGEGHDQATSRLWLPNHELKTSSLP